MNSESGSFRPEMGTQEDGRRTEKGGSAPNPHRRNLWPAAIISFFVVAIAGLIAFIVFCQMHPTDLVAGDYYEQEIRYQSEMERLNRALGVSEHVSASFDRLANRVLVALPRDHAQASGVVHLYRPSASKLDRAYELKLRADGTQELETGTLLPGLWRVRIRWVYQGREYVIERKLEVPT